MTKIWAQTLVCNEERYIWYAIRSVVEYVDKVMVWDTGSDDATVSVIKRLYEEYPGNIELEEFGKVTGEKYTILRQKMLERTKADWFMILDGDEVWWDDSIRQSVERIRAVGNRLDTLVNPYVNLVGDVFHFEPENEGEYEIDGRRGHLTIRFINTTIPGLYTSKPHGQHGYFDNYDKLIQLRNRKRREYIDAGFMHFTHLERSINRKHDVDVPKRFQKLKKRVGKELSLDYYYPEVFFGQRPLVVPSPWNCAPLEYRIRSMFYKPLRMVKSKIFPVGSGY